MDSFQKIKLDPYGVVIDTDPLDVGDEWTNVQNMRFNDLAAEKFPSETQLTTTTAEAYHLQFNGNHIVPLWVYMGNGRIRTTDGSTDSNISPAVISNGTDWDSCLFNTFPVMNNTVDAPFYWQPGTANALDLPAFPANTVCKAIRPYRSFLIALNTTLSGAEQPNRLIWSDSSDAGAIPASWDIADPTTLAGDAYLSDSRGEIIDGLQLRDLFVVYKTHAIYILRLVSAQSVMRLDKVQINSGLLAKNCVAEFKGKHFIVSDADVVLFDGQSVQSIADKRVRSEIFGNIDTINYRNSYVVRYDRQDEIWFCYPTAGQEVPNMAAIWNWKDNTWTFRTVGSVRHIASGLANFAVSDKWIDATYTWDSAEYTWNPTSSNPTTDTLVGAAAGELRIIDEGFIDPYPSSLEKASMDLGDEERIKLVDSVTPRITADTGTRVFIRLGTQDSPDEDIFWHPEQEYTVGIDREAYFTVKGRYISIRMRNQDPGEWKCHGFTFKASMAGRH